MPRMLNYDDVTNGIIDGDLYYSDIVMNGHARLSEPGDNDHMGNALAPGTMLFAIDLDGTSPWVTSDDFYAVHDFYAENWNDYPDEESDCDCFECRRERGESDENVDPYAESTDDDPTAAGSALHIPSLPGRPTRLTSAEIEVGMGGNYLAEAFYNAGLSDNDYMLEYHSGEGDQFVRVEEDASVAAEVIFSKMQLDTVDHAANFERGIGIIRQAINDGACKLDMRCGLHVHVGVNRDLNRGIPGYTSQNLTSLYHLWNYLEDTIFRLASANWKGHRSEYGNDYAPKTRKGRTQAVEVGYSRASLNLSNYLDSVRYTIPNFDHPMSDWSEHDLMGTPTIEFRVFNTSANARKIRGYVALCQALIAYAQDNFVTPDILPPMEWTELSEPDHEASRERIKFIMSELPLTSDERADLAYCIEKCSLGDVVA